MLGIHRYIVHFPGLFANVNKVPELVLWAHDPIAHEKKT